MIKKILTLTACLLLCNTASYANNRHRVAFSKKTYSVRQGRTLAPRITSNKPLESVQIKFLSKIYDCYEKRKKPFTYECYIPIECEEKTGSHPIRARVKTKNNKKAFLKSSADIKKVFFPRQKGFKMGSGALRKKLKKEKPSCYKKDLWDDKRFKKLVRRGNKNKNPLWEKPFGIPSKVYRYSTSFGEIRKANNKKGYRIHDAVDIVPPYLPKYGVNIPVWASNNGKIIIKDRYVYSGKTIVIDHGFGVFTYYYHLNKFANLSVGDYVRKGTEVGRVGNTGYSTGVHLHWALSVKGKLVDPLEWTTKKFF